MVIPGNIVALAPSQQSSPMRMGFANDPLMEASRSEASTSCVSVQIMQPGAMRTRSPMVMGAES